MLNIFKRLSRLARSELNSLADKIGSRSEDDAEVEEAEETLQEEIKSADADSAWPQEVRQAYASLEIPLGSDEKAAKKAYRELLKRYHPDKHVGHPERQETANELTRKIREAYETVTTFLEARAKRS